MNALSTLAQTTTTIINDDAEGAALAAGIVAFMIFALFFALIGYIASSIIAAKLLKKAKQPGWAGWVPVYNVWKLLEISGYPGWLVLAPIVISIIPIINALAGLVGLAASIFMAIAVGRAFGKRDAGWIVLLALLPIVGYAILAFGDAKYKKPTEKDLLFKI